MKKTMLIVAAVLTVFGLALFAGAFAASGWDFSKFSTVKMETNTCKAEGDFRDIEIRTDTADVAFALSTDGRCTVVCEERETQKHTVSVENGTLKIIASADQRKWYEYIGIFTASESVTVYLPEESYGALVVDGDTGRVSIPEAFSFESVEIKTHTGDISIQGIRAGQLDLSASTGRIRVASVTCEGAVSARVSTGRTELTDVTCASLISTGSTGSITLKNVAAAGSMAIERDTGNVRFEGSDAAEITVKTDTGHVTGTLRTEKVFITKTDTGAVRVPDTTTGGRCEITTDTGDIRIEIAGR